ncbi:MAG: hypothetical protein ACTHM9_03970 [Gemmatimonadales bacterium]
MTSARWLERHTAHAPPALRARVYEYAATQASDGTAEPAALACAGQEALGRVLEHPGDRSVALDLLAADALITLALLAQAQRAPAELGVFATTLLRNVPPGT